MNITLTTLIDTDAMQKIRGCTDISLLDFSRRERRILFFYLFDKITLFIYLVMHNVYIILIV